MYSLLVAMLCHNDPGGHGLVLRDSPSFFAKGGARVQLLAPSDPSIAYLDILISVTLMALPKFAHPNMA